MKKCHIALLIDYKNGRHAKEMTKKVIERAVRVYCNTLKNKPIYLLEQAIKGIQTNRKNYSKAILSYLLVTNSYLAVAIYYYMSIIEENDERYIHAAAYKLRIVVRMGKDPSDITLQIVDNLAKGGMLEAAKRLNRIFAGTDIYPKIGNSKARAELIKTYETKIKILEETTEDRILIDTRTKKVEISVVMSVYNEGERFRKAIRLYLAQTDYVNGNVEYIFVDSNSPANETEIAREELLDKENILYIQTSRRETLYAALHRGTNYVSGKYICLTTPSDYIVTDGLEQMRISIEESGTDWAQGDVFNWPARPITSTQAKGLKKTINCAYNYSQELVLLSQNYITFSILFRKTIYEEIGGLDGLYLAAGDTDFKIRAATIADVKQTGENLVYTEYCEERLTGHPRAEIEHYISDAINQNKLTMMKIAARAKIKPERVYSEILRKTLCFRKAASSQKVMRPILAMKLAGLAKEEKAPTTEQDVIFINDYSRIMRKMDSELWKYVENKRIDKKCLKAKIEQFNMINERWRQDYLELEVGERVKGNITPPLIYGDTLWR